MGRVGVLRVVSYSFFFAVNVKFTVPRQKLPFIVPLISLFSLLRLPFTMKVALQFPEASAVNSTARSTILPVILPLLFTLFRQVPESFSPSWVMVKVMEPLAPMPLTVPSVGPSQVPATSMGPHADNPKTIAHKAKRHAVLAINRFICRNLSSTYQLK